MRLMKRSDLPPGDDMKVGIYVLNYNGKELLEQCIPSIIESAAASRYRPQIVVIDNKSSDGSKDLVNRNFQKVYFKEMRDNRVLCSFNDAAEDSDDDIMIFLNNDLVVDKNFIDPLIDIFLSKDRVFLAGARVYNFDGSDIEEGRTKPVIKWGIVKGISRFKGYENELEGVSYTLQAGFGAFDRKKFLELGGYDPLYLPGIMEDTDICFRAWKRGYYCYNQPDSHIYHMGKASFSKRFGNRKLLAISHRNTYFFIWKNITNKSVLVMNILFILPRMLYALITFKREIIWGFFWFLANIPDVIRSRAREISNRKYNVRTDTEVFGMLK